MNIKGKGKDHENVRADLEEMGICPELYVQEADVDTQNWHDEGFLDNLGRPVIPLL